MRDVIELLCNWRFWVLFAPVFVPALALPIVGVMEKIKEVIYEKELQ